MISIGYVIGTSVAGILTLASLATILFGAWAASGAKRGKFYREDLGMGRIIWLAGLGGLVMTVGGWVWATWPSFDMQYHSYRRISGPVQAVSSRFLSAGQNQGSTQNFVVRINGQDYRCDDTRCALVKPGDTLTLRCIREWQYASTSGWDCNFVAVRPVAP